MESIILRLAIPYAVGLLVSGVDTLDYAGEKQKFAAGVGQVVHNAWLDSKVVAAGDAVIDGVHKLATDKPDLIAAVTALANHDKVAAVGALSNALKGVLPAELGALLAA